jgi:uncharacterized damage-inducible protein DinB
MWDVACFSLNAENTPMKIEEIKLLYDYNAWADARILAACAQVSPEQYAAPTNIGTGHASLRATMVHLLDNLWQWRITFQGFYNEPLEDDAAYDETELHEDTFPTLIALQDRWATEQRELRVYIDSLDAQTLNGTIRYVIPGAVRERVVWHVLIDALIHATQHRSEAAALLTLYGQSPGDYDLTLFLNERAQAKA